MKFVSERLQRVFQLPPAERRILGQAWVLFLLADLALRILPFKTLLALLQKLRKPEGSAVVGSSSVPRLIWLVDVAGRFVPVKATCLEHALVLSWILGRRGIATTLRIGVCRQDRGIQAHAWLEREGEVILGVPEPAGYAPLYRAR